ncbi:HEPN domain-containing protein [Candidatus Saganbacteria bacterium]|nr:HEPN domain-containing protein [Candidatus Saganbacteria bacterium]
MKYLVQKWLEYAKADLEAAEVLVLHPKSHYSYQLAVLHCQQAIEKILKTILVDMGKEPKRVHNLIFLLEESGLDPPIEFKNYIEQLNPHYQPARYPDISHKGPVLRYDKKTADYHFAKTKEVFSWIEKKLSHKE